MKNEILLHEKKYFVHVWLWPPWTRWSASESNENACGMPQSGQKKGSDLVSLRSLITCSVTGRGQLFGASKIQNSRTALGHALQISSYRTALRHAFYSYFFISDRFPLKRECMRHAPVWSEEGFGSSNACGALVLVRLQGEPCYSLSYNCLHRDMLSISNF